MDLIRSKPSFLAIAAIVFSTVALAQKRTEENPAMKYSKENIAPTAKTAEWPVSTRPHRPPLRKPTYANVKYGSHAKHLLDFWKAESDAPTPLVVYIHGGGFTGGSKGNLKSKLDTMEDLLHAGISVASVEYRLVSDKPLPAAHFDALRALQFIRSKSAAWNIDKQRVGAFGGSAGAQLCMWLAFHEEMAIPDSDDPVKRESSRLLCVATNGGQATMDLDWWTNNIPGYTGPHRNQLEIFGVKTAEELKPLVKEVSVINHLTADDPPIFMRYSQHPGDPIPEDPAKARNWQIHHVTFGIALKEKMDALGIEADLQYPGAETTYESNSDFFIRKLAGGTRRSPTEINEIFFYPPP